MRILFFIESLRSGGKERRLLELVQYLKRNTDNVLSIVMTENNIHYQYVLDLDIEIKIIERKYLKKDPSIFYRFLKYCNEFKPDIIHTWGSMLAFYTIPTVIFRKVIHINSHIADVPLKRNKLSFQYFVTQLGFKFSNIILANSYIGLKSYEVSSPNSKVIYNGIRLERFNNLPDKKSIREKYGITSKYCIIHVASFTAHKNYSQFIDIAEQVGKIRKDVTFFGVGDNNIDPDEFKQIVERSSKMDNVILHGKINDVESLVNACDIGVLFSFTEGISNSIIEYMACSKTVIARNAGGTKELVKNNLTGFLITDESNIEISQLINKLLNDDELRLKIGSQARNYIENNITIERMGNEFVKLYSEVFSRNIQPSAVSGSH